MAQDLFQVLEGIEVSEDDIKEAEIFAVEYIQPLYPDLDLREGTGLRDSSIRANATLLALLRKGLEYYFTVNSLDNATNQTPEQTVDKLMSNFFTSRKEGTTSVIRARLYFTIQKQVNITPSLFFSTNNESFFFPSENYAIASGNLNYDGTRQLYYTDIDLESEGSGEEYNISSGQLLYFSNFDPFFVSAEVLYLKEKSIPRENNIEFINRTRSAISTRNLINEPSISGRIQESFNLFSSITSVGMGETEMLRDLVTVRTGNPPTSAKVHVGGKVDVYVDPDLETTTVVKTVDGNGEVTFEGTDVPLLEVNAIQGGEDTVDHRNVSNPYLVNYDSNGNPVEPKYDVGLSADQQVKVTFLNNNSNPDLSQTGKACSFQIKKVTGVPSLQSFLDNEANRVICADYLARSYEILEVIAEINTHTTSSVPATEVYDYVNQYVKSLDPGDPFVMSELMEVLSSDLGIQNIETPISVRFLKHKKHTINSVLLDTLNSWYQPTRLQRFVLKEVTFNGDQA